MMMQSNRITNHNSDNSASRVNSTNQPPLMTPEQLEEEAKKHNSGGPAVFGSQ